jgi:hypothetical protein
MEYGFFCKACAGGSMEENALKDKVRSMHERYIAKGGTLEMEITADQREAITKAMDTLTAER